MKRTRTELERQPDQVLGDYDFIEARNVRMEELTMVVDFASEVRVVFLGRFEYDLRNVVNPVLWTFARPLSRYDGMRSPLIHW